VPTFNAEAEGITVDDHPKILDATPGGREEDPSPGRDRGLVKSACSWRKLSGIPDAGGPAEDLESAGAGAARGRRLLHRLHRSPHKGFSVEFKQHRQYVHGDEIRHLD
jgi:hypothetical protein